MRTQWIRIVTATLVTVALAACAGPQTVRSNVTSFSQASLLDQGAKTFRFERKPAQADSLEHATYEHLVSDQLQLLGYTQDANGRLAVSFDYSISSQTYQVQSGYPYGDPFFGPSYGLPGYYGYGRRGRYWGGYPYWGDPFWGGYGGVSYPRTIARSQLKLDIRVAGSKAKAFEGTAVSSGSVDDMPAVMPYLVQAIFTDFPGLNGQTRRVDVPVEAQ
ncbi:DUF4136 domain-containing protein [soil metagenome]